MRKGDAWIRWKWICFDSSPCHKSTAYMISQTQWPTPLFPVQGDLLFPPKWFGSKLGKEYVKAVYFHSAYLTSMRNARLDEAQAGIKIAWRNINNRRHADDTTLMAESEEELKSLLKKMKEESGKSWLKAQHSEN